MTQIPDMEIERLLDGYGIPITTQFCDQCREYISLLLRWNAKISLTAITNPVDILRFHFGESLFAARAVFMEHGRLADFGSGAGFPGLPLGLAMPKLKVLLIEANAKKAAFLSEAIRTLQMTNATVAHSRLQDLNISNNEKLDFVVSRAVGQHRELLPWARESSLSSGRVILWLGSNDAAEVSGYRGWLWNPVVPIPGSDRRCILVGSIDDR